MDRRVARHLIQRLNRDAEHIAARFGLRYRSIEAEHPNVKRRYGMCYDDGSIRIRLAHIVSERPLKYSSLVNTLCHELAHLRHFNHGPQFKSLYQRILAWARKERIYRPGRDPFDPDCLAQRTLPERGNADVAMNHRKPGLRPGTSPVQPELDFGGAGRRTSDEVAPAVAPTRRRTPEQLSLPF